MTVHTESKYKFDQQQPSADSKPANQLSHMRLKGSHDHVAGEVFLGKFTSIKNDFSLPGAFDGGQFRNQTHWDQSKREKVKRFRFVVCNLSLFALALSVMSRSMFNLAIVEMTKDVHAEAVVAFIQENSTESSRQQQLPQVENSIKLQEDPRELVDEFTVNKPVDDNQDTAGSNHSEWSGGMKNFLLSAFFIGYAPSMFFSGGIAEQYGSVTLLSVSVVGSALINVFTPLMAAYSYHSLAASRIALGLLQGGLVPACYDMFNRWLTVTEMSVFVPLLKVALAIGTLAGSSLPGLVVLSGYHWTWNFYIGSSVCFIWALFWFPLATSTPQTNRWIEESELQRIMRKKSTPLAVIKLSNANNPNAQGQQAPLATDPVKPRIPWLQIMTSPSVLALTLVKFTFNLGLDFLNILSPTYLSEIHGASTGTVSLIVGSGCVMQMMLMSLIGSLATYVVRNRTLGLSRTYWRKIFQGTSNFTMALIYGLIPYLGRFDLVVSLFMLVYFFAVFATGGESMVPYDLSFKFPATIMGFAHSLSILSGFVLPSVRSLILGENEVDPAQWNVLFLLISGALALGGLVFVLVLKSKPFLLNERAKYDDILAREKSKLQNGYSNQSQQQ